MLTFYRESLAGLNCIVTNHDSASPEALVLVCHGFGAPGTDLVAVADEMTSAVPELAGRVRFVFPAAPISLDPSQDSRAWWPISMSQFEKICEPNGIKSIAEFIPDELDDCHARLVEIIRHFAEADQLSSRQIIVGGFSQGAMLATDVFLRSPLELGGLIAWSGTVINQSSWSKANAQRSPGRVVQSHGYLDPVLSFVGATALRDLLKQHHHVDFLPFQGYHAIPGQAMKAAGKLVLHQLQSTSQPS